MKVTIFISGTKNQIDDESYFAAIIGWGGSVIPFPYITQYSPWCELLITFLVHSSWIEVYRVKQIFTKCDSYYEDGTCIDWVKMGKHLFL